MNNIRFLFNKSLKILELTSGRAMCPEDLFSTTGFSKNVVYKLINELERNSFLEVDHSIGLTNYWSPTQAGLKVVEFVQEFDSDDISENVIERYKAPDDKPRKLNYQSDKNMFYSSKNKENVCQLFWMWYIKRNNKLLIFGNREDRNLIRKIFNDNGMYLQYNKFDEIRDYSDDELYDLYKEYMQYILTII